MAYKDLLEKIFDEKVDAIEENQFVKILPELLFRPPKYNTVMNGDDMAKLLCARFELGGIKKMTLEQLGREHGVTKEQIRRWQNEAIRRLKHPIRINKYLVTPPNAKLTRS